MTMPIDAKAGCLYPNNARALMEARTRGFDNCLLADMLGNVAELATANIFMAKDGVIMTPMANGSFLNGVTRQRVLKLLREDGKRDATRGDAELRRFRRSRRDFRDRQFRQGDAGAPHRAARPAAGAVSAARANSIGISRIRRRQGPARLYRQGAAGRRRRAGAAGVSATARDAVRRTPAAGRRSGARCDRSRRRTHRRGPTNARAANA
jgi:hypothetical protein